MRRDVYQAIADPVRREIIGLLSEQTMNLNSLASNFEISRPAISKHIKILQECGIVNTRKSGRERFCTIQAEALSEVADWVDQFRALWEYRLDSFEDYLVELQSKQNENDQ